MPAIPTTVQVPGMYVSVDSTRAFSGPAVLKYKALIIGQRLATGTVSTTRLDKLTPGLAETLYGKMSMLDLMARKWFENNLTTEVYGISIADNGTTKATWTLTFTGTSTAAGTVVVYVDGIRIPVEIASGTSAANVGNAVQAAFTAEHPVVATDDNAGVVTLTARNAGSVMDTMDVRLNYNSGETLPAGVGCTIATDTSGATDPDIATIITALGDQEFHIIVNPFSDDTNMDKLDTELASRFGYAREIQGFAVTAHKPARSVATVADAVTAMQTYGNLRNSPHNMTPHCYKCLESQAEIAAAWGGIIAREAEVDEVYPFTSLELIGIHGPAAAERFSWSNNNDVLADGISTFYVDSTGAVKIQKAVTNYQTNDAGAPDVAYHMANTPLQIMYLRYSWRVWMSKFNRAKLMDDDSRVQAGQLILTPKTGKAEAVAWARSLERLGKLENIDQFKRDVTVTRNGTDATRLDFLLPPDLVNQFIVGATQLQFLLQSPAVAAA
jgi:phage tail sheath gpL-like